MIRIRVFKRTGRQFFEAQWECPLTGKKKTRSTKANIRRDAERFAARLEQQLNDGTLQRHANITWADARERYEREAYPLLSKGGRGKMMNMFNLVERVLAPAKLAAINEDHIGQIATHLRGLGRSEYTVKGHLVALRVFLRWSNRQKILDHVPTIVVPSKLAGGMKGRAVTREEFERILKAVPKVVGEGRAKEWRHLLKGLWLSGLRLNEALTLHWTDPSAMCIDLTHKHPMFRIQASAEKGRTFRLLPMVPAFYRFLMKTPKEERRGLVFKPACPDTGERPARDWASKLITRIGKQAKVMVSEKTIKRKRRVKWASAHDIRRSFGFRWSNRVRATLLMLLMRHKSITTTQTFYIGQDASAAADEVWRGSANTFANTGHKSGRKAKGDDSQLITRQSLPSTPGEIRTPDRRIRNPFLVRHVPRQFEMPRVSRVFRRVFPHGCKRLLTLLLTLHASLIPPSLPSQHAAPCLATSESEIFSKVF